MKPLEVVHIAAFLRVPEDEVLRHTYSDSTGSIAEERHAAAGPRTPARVRRFSACWFALFG